MGKQSAYSYCLSECWCPTLCTRILPKITTTRSTAEVMAHRKSPTNLKGLDTDEITEWGRRLLNRKGQHMVFNEAGPADDMCRLTKDIVRTVRCYVFNTADQEETGRHWVAVYFNKDHQMSHFFDPFGRDITEFKGCWLQNLIRLTPSYTYSKRVVQARNSALCAEHCLYYLAHRQRNQSDYTNDSIITKYQNDESVFKWAVTIGLFPANYKYIMPDSQVAEALSISNALDDLH